MLFVVHCESPITPSDAIFLCPLANRIRYSRSDNDNLARLLNKKLHPSFRYFSAAYE